MKTAVLYLGMCLVLLSCGRDTDFFDVVQRRPGASLLLFPYNNETCTDGRIISEQESEITFLWEPSVSTDSYELFISNLANSETTQYSTTVPEMAVVLQRGTPYSWYVMSRSTQYPEGTTSAIWAFYNAEPGITNHVPFPAEALAPVDQSEVTANTTINLRWSARDLDDDIIAYDLYFGENPNPPLWVTEIQETQLNVPIARGRTYFWKVVTKDVQGNASNSQVFSFTIRP